MGFEARLKTGQIIFKSKINREIIPKTWTNNKIGKKPPLRTLYTDAI